MAIDLGLNRSFLRLRETGMGDSKTPAELEGDRELVYTSRIWFSVRLSGIADRPILIRKAVPPGASDVVRTWSASDHRRGRDDTQLPRLLETPFDALNGCPTHLIGRDPGHQGRVVAISAEEFQLTMAAPIHVELTASPDKPLSTETLARLQEANDSFDAWARYWDRRLGEKLQSQHR
jgi:hypothetical protein